VISSHVVAFFGVPELSPCCDGALTARLPSRRSLDLVVCINSKCRHFHALMSDTEMLAEIEHSLNVLSTQIKVIVRSSSFSNNVLSYGASPR
jgi:hypothetical protein